MRVATIASLGGSAVLGLGALLVAKIWLPSQSAPKVAQAAVPVQQGDPVVVASHALSYGTKLQAKDLRLVRLPAGAEPPGAYTSIDQVLKLDAGGAPVVLVPIAEREPVLPTRLSGPGMRPTVAAEIEPGKRAFTIGVTDVAGGGGHILPGDHVDVLATRDVSVGQKDMPGPRFVTDVVLQNIRILGMDLNADPSSDKPTVARTATLEVGVQDAGKLALAGQTGTLSLALRRPGASEIDQVRPILTSDLGTGARAPRVVSLAPRRRAPRPPAEPAGSTIIVVNGAEPSSQRVPREGWGAGS